MVVVLKIEGNKDAEQSHIDDSDCKDIYADDCHSD